MIRYKFLAEEGHSFVSPTSVRQTGSISALYHENSKLSTMYKEVEFAPLLIPHEKMVVITQAFKSYRYAKVKIPLPTEFRQTAMSLEEAIRKRRSVRHFSSQHLTLEEIAQILYFSYGVIDKYKTGNVVHYRRAAPSGGALYPLEIYPVVFRAEGIEKGIYHYNVKEHLLELIRLGDYQEEIWECAFRQQFAREAAFTLVITAIPQRTQWKYLERGYRYLLIEAGHLAQNTYLIGTAMGIGICTIGGFLDDTISDLLFLDGVQEYPVYLIAGGKV